MRFVELFFIFIKYFIESILSDDIYRIGIDGFA